eukprot:scaffold11077_cov78-Cyclotella_meneghiniana.AAC.2
MLQQKKQCGQWRVEKWRWRQYRHMGDIGAAGQSHRRQREPDRMLGVTPVIAAKAMCKRGSELKGRGTNWGWIKEVEEKRHQNVNTILGIAREGEVPTRK